MSERAEATQASDPKKRSGGWLLPGVLLGIYIVLKFQGWGLANLNQELQTQLEQLRPTLSSKVLHEQLEGVYQACLLTTEKIQQSGVRFDRLMGFFSKDLPTSITLKHVEASSGGQLKIQGVCLVGIRSPEAVLLPWAQQLRPFGAPVKIQELRPETEGLQAWWFEILVGAS